MLFRSNGTTATLLTANSHGLNNGDTVVVSIGDVTFDGTFVVTAVDAALTGTSFSYGLASTVASTPVSPYGFAGKLVDITATSDPTATHVVLASKPRIEIGGEFTTFDGQTRNRVAQLIGGNINNAQNLSGKFQFESATYSVEIGRAHV